MTLKELLQDEDMFDHAMKVYLDIICEGIPCEEAFSYELNPKRIIAEFMYRIEQEEEGREQYFEEMINEEEELLKKDKKTHPLKIQYTLRLINSLKENHDLVFKVIDEFPKRLSRARDKIVETYDVMEDLSAYDLFKEIVMRGYYKTRVA